MEATLTVAREVNRASRSVVQIVNIAIRILEPRHTAWLTVPRHMHVAFEHDTSTGAHT
jgi:hypothetical protein